MKKNQSNHSSGFLRLACIISLVVLCVMPLIGCGDAGTADTERQGYRLYYLNEAGTRTERYYLNIEETDTIAIVQSMIESMKSVEVSGASRAIPDSVSFNKAELTGDILYLYLDGSLDGISSGRQMMLFACVTRTVSQLPEVSGLMLFVGGQPVSDGNGRSMGIMRDSKFVNNAVDDPDDYKESEVTLYFANSNKDMLVRTAVQASYRSATPIERVVVEQLIAGPRGGTESASLPSGLTLLSINVRDGICYVNFDDKFVTDTVSGYDSIPVYSVVNSLMELEGIGGVQISINGANDVTMPMGEINFQSPFTYNQDIVEIR